MQAPLATLAGHSLLALCRRFDAQNGPTARDLIQKPIRSGQGPSLSVGFVICWSFSLGLRPSVLPSPPYLRFGVSVSLFLSTETSLHMGRPQGRTALSVQTSGMIKT